MCVCVCVRVCVCVWEFVHVIVCVYVCVRECVWLLVGGTFLCEIKMKSKNVIIDGELQRTRE